jgi:hypothetical protein
MVTKNLSLFWKSALKFLNVFKGSKIPSTILWTMEILFLLTRKYSPKELMSDKDFKKDLRRYVK